VVALAASSAASGQKTQPVLRRPNPLFVSLGLDYVNPITLPNGTVVTSLTPQQQAVIHASVVDLEFLEYASTGDLGGFIPAPIGWLANGNCYPPRPGVVCPGEALTGRLGTTGIPLYKHQAQKKVNSYTWAVGHIGPVKPCVACGAFTFPGGFPTSPLPGGSSGFGGQLPPPPPPPPPPPSTNPKPSAGSCGTAGISIFSNLPKCRIYVFNRKPGDGTFEQMKITNTADVPYVLSLEASGTPNQLWQDLEMGVWQQGEPAPTPLPPLHFWSDQYTKLVTLAPGQVVHYTIELYLPLIAGNSDQNLSAVVSFNWRAVQKLSG
jgi:hypothetical protein